MQQLTRTEEDIMQRIWDHGPVFVRELIEAMPEPKPNYNTISSVVRILEQKGFVGHEAFGKSHRYHAIVPKSAYRRRSFRRLLQDYFDGSHAAMLQFFSKEEGLDAAELQRMLEALPEEDGGAADRSTDASNTPKSDAP